MVSTASSSDSWCTVTQYAALLLSLTAALLSLCELLTEQGSAQFDVTAYSCITSFRQDRQLIST